MLKTVEEHNQERRRAHKGYALQERYSPSGVACPKCGGEMLADNHTVTASDPPYRYVNCDCGHADFILA